MRRSMVARTRSSLQQLQPAMQPLTAQHDKRVEGGTGLHSVQVKRGAGSESSGE
jgi:hypothetical protein